MPFPLHFSRHSPVPCSSPGPRSALWGRAAAPAAPGCARAVVLGLGLTNQALGGTKPAAPRPPRPPRSPLTILPPTSRAGARRLPASFPASLPCLLPSAAARGPPPRTPPARPGGGGRARALCEGLSPGPALPQPRCPHTGGWLGQTTTAPRPMHAPGRGPAEVSVGCKNLCWSLSFPG